MNFSTQLCEYENPHTELMRRCGRESELKTAESRHESDYLFFSSVHASN